MENSISLAWIFHKGSAEKVKVAEGIEQRLKIRVTACRYTLRSNFKALFNRFSKIGILSAAACEISRLVGGIDSIEPRSKGVFLGLIESDPPLESQNLCYALAHIAFLSMSASCSESVHIQTAFALFSSLAEPKPYVTPIA